MINFIALFFIGIYSLSSALWGSNFSEHHLTIPSLGFPVFIGEILLAACLLLWMIKYWRQGMVLTRWHQLFFAYWVFIVLKALWDYRIWGPLAFRNAALFYYLIFVLFGYSFYKKEYFNQKFVYCGLAIFIFLTSRFWDSTYFWYTAFILGIIMMMKVRTMKWKVLFSIVFLGLLKYSAFFAGSRTDLISTLTALCFLALVFILYFLKFNLKIKVIVGSCALCTVLVGIFIFADRNGVQSCLKLRDMVQMYTKVVAYLDQERKNYRPEVLPVALYHDNKDTTQSLSHRLRLGILNEIQYSGEPVQSKYRNFYDAQGNGVFRMLIWHDMFVELKETKSLLGVGLGKPQRSPSLEMLWWASGEWSRDGWVAPHNVYLHLIYRLGIAGLLVIAGILGVVFYLTRTFIILQSTIGILLVSALIYWLMSCNFLVILELPHYAIPFWTLMGMTLAYCNEQLTRHQQLQ